MSLEDLRATSRRAFEIMDEVELRTIMEALGLHYVEPGAGPYADELKAGLPR